MKRILVLAAALAVVCGVALAANPADVDALYRVWPTEAGYYVNDGSLGFYGWNDAVGARGSFSFSEYETVGSSGHFREISWSHPVEAKGNFQVAGSWIATHGLKFGLETVFADAAFGRLALGAAISTGSGQPVFSPRYKAGKIWYYLLARSGARVLFGAMLPAGQLVYELAAGTRWQELRVCRGSGRYCPELRLRHQDGRNFFGFGLFWFPK